MKGDDDNDNEDDRERHRMVNKEGCNRDKLCGKLTIGREEST
jgi:hypothetical protein